MKYLFSILLFCIAAVVNAECKLPGFDVAGSFNEQVKTFAFEPDVKVEINAPSVSDFDPKKPTKIMLYALPNTNTIEWTKGKRVTEGVDWRYGIQHIAAQTRYIRSLNPDFNFVAVYMETKQRVWKVWRKETPNSDSLLIKLVDDIREIFKDYKPYIVLSGHSGGGNFTFGFIENVEEIPSWVCRISFLDSNYNWEEKDHGEKLIKWLKKSKKNRLSVICYDDRNALRNGKHIVSDTGGTGYRSKIMLNFLRENTRLKWVVKDDSVMTATTSKNNQVQFLWLKNPEHKIFHSVLVERNGMIQGELFGTKYEGVGYEFWGEPAYDRWIEE